MGEIADEYVNAMLSEGIYFKSHDNCEPKVICKYCRTDNVYWEHVGGRFVLYNKDLSKHECLKPKIDSEGFEDVK